MILHASSTRWTPRWARGDDAGDTAGEPNACGAGGRTRRRKPTGVYAGGAAAPAGVPGVPGDGGAPASVGVPGVPGDGAAPVGVRGGVASMARWSVSARLRCRCALAGLSPGVDLEIKYPFGRKLAHMRGSSTRVETHALHAVMKTLRAFRLRTPARLSRGGRSVYAENTILLMGTEAFAKKYGGTHAEIYTLVSDCKKSKPRPTTGVDTRVLECLEHYLALGAIETSDVTLIALVGMKMYIKTLRRNGINVSLEQKVLAEMTDAMDKANVTTFAHATRKGDSHTGMSIAQMRRNVQAMERERRDIFRRRSRDKAARARG